VNPRKLLISEERKKSFLFVEKIEIDSFYCITQIMTQLFFLFLAEVDVLMEFFFTMPQHKCFPPLTVKHERRRVGYTVANLLRGEI
jgi:hypothetical protein